MSLSDEVRNSIKLNHPMYVDTLTKLADRIAALEAERDGLAAELKKHCGCEFDPETAEYVLKCQTHKRVEDELSAAPQRERERLAKLCGPGAYLHHDAILQGKLSGE